MSAHNPRGGRPLTPRALRELATLDLVDQSHLLVEAPAALDAIERTVAHLRRRIGAAATHGHRAHLRVVQAQAREDDTVATPLAEVLQLPERRTPEPPSAPFAVAA